MTKKAYTCEHGHVFYKSSSCRSCPTCAKQSAKAIDWMIGVSAPARRALIREGITQLDQLCEFSKSELLKLHGIGATTLPKLEQLLKAAKLDFKK